MNKILSIDPGRCKCGMVLADLEQKIIFEAVVIDSHLLFRKVKLIKSNEPKLKVIMGNGTSSKENARNLNFLKSDLILVEERNTTYRAKKRYFEIFPLTGLKRFLPREIFLNKINLDAISALIILEDYCQSKFDLIDSLESKTWLK